MEIRKKKPTNLIDELNAGECFLYEGEYYMKTDEEEMNVVSLHNGHLYFFDGDLMVLPVALVAEVV